MTQTEQIAELINEASALNQTFQGKKAEIEAQQKLLEESVSNKIQELETWKHTGVRDALYRVAYVDGVNGNDDTAIEGRSDRPYKTFDRAYSDNVYYGGKLNIRLKAIDGYVYEYSQNPHAMGGAVLRVETWDYDGTNKAVIQPKTYLHPDFPDYTFMYRFEVWESGQITLGRIKLKIPQKIDDKPYNRDLYGGTPILGNGTGSIYIDYVDIDTSKEDCDIVMLTRYYGSTQVVFNGCNLNIGDNFLVNNRVNHPFVFKLDGVNLVTANVGWREQCIRNIVRDADSGNPINVISDENFSS